MTEWVPSSWDAVKTGDRGSRVQIHRPTGFIEGTLEHRDAESVLIGFAAGQEQGLHSTRFYRRDGWNLFVPAPTTPELPTDPGVYTDRVGDAWQLTSGQWWYGNFKSDDVADFAPFTRLLSEAETAKKIIERIDAMRDGGEVTTLGQVQALLAAEFGVS